MMTTSSYLSKLTWILIVGQAYAFPMYNTIPSHGRLLEAPADSGGGLVG